jgi:hypothetical protein
MISGIIKVFIQLGGLDEEYGGLKRGVAVAGAFRHHEKRIGPVCIATAGTSKKGQDTYLGGIVDTKMGGCGCADWDIVWVVNEVGFDKGGEGSCCREC